jgi:hypothetical protein
MAKRSIEVIITANAARFTRTFRSLAHTVKKFNRFTARSFHRLKWVAVGVAGAIGWALKSAFDFEMYRNQFNVLIGDVKQSAAHFKAIKDLAAWSPIDIGPLVKASKQLQVYGLSGKENLEWLERLGDIASAVNFQQFEQITYWVGRLRAEVAAGGGMGRGPLRLTQLAALSPQAKLEMERARAMGAGVSEVMNILAKDMMFAKGSMREFSKTGWGAFSVLQDAITYAGVEFGEAFLGFAVDSLKQLTDKLNEMREDKTIQQWAERAVKAFSSVKEVFGGLFGSKEDRAESLNTIFSVIEKTFALGALSAIDVLLKYAPDVGKAIAEGLEDTDIGRFIVKARKIDETVNKYNPVYHIGRGIVDNIGYGIDRLFFTTQTGMPKNAVDGKDPITAARDQLWLELKELVNKKQKSDLIRAPFMIDLGKGRKPAPEGLDLDADGVPSTGTGILSIGELFEQIYNAGKINLDARDSREIKMLDTMTSIQSNTREIADLLSEGEQL